MIVFRLLLELVNLNKMIISNLKAKLKEKGSVPDQRTRSTNFVLLRTLPGGSEREGEIIKPAVSSDSSTYLHFSLSKITAVYGFIVRARCQQSVQAKLDLQIPCR